MSAKDCPEACYQDSSLQSLRRSLTSTIRDKTYFWGKDVPFSGARPQETLRLRVTWYDAPALISDCIGRLVTRFFLANRTMNRELLQSQHHQVSNASATSSKITVAIC
jgi:hypothetical protein